MKNKNGNARKRYEIVKHNARSVERLLVSGLATVFVINAFAERVPEYDSQYTAASGYVTLTANDGSTTSSWDTVGYWSDKLVPHSTTNYYVGSARTLNVRKNTGAQTAAPFGGAKLVVAGKLMDYGTSSWHTQLGDAIIMLPGSEYAMSSAGHVDSGSMEILGTGENPVQMSFSNSSSYSKNMLVAFKLERERCLEFYSSKTNVTYYMLSSLPDVLGTILIDDHVTCINADEFFAGHTGFTGNTGGNHNYITAGGGFVVVGDAFDTGVKTVQFCCLHHIDGLALGQTLFDVDENQIRNTSAVCDCVGNCCTYVAGADNCYFCHFN